jgi:potassium-transporting ATPase KdpC subunit
MKNVLATLRPAITLLVLLTVLTGIVYPVVLTGLAQLLFAHAANGSIVVQDGAAVGSSLLGQSFSDPRHFWGRPSGTSPRPYDALASGGANLGPLNPALTEGVRGRIAALRAADPGNVLPVPIDLVSASASGLDPEISVAAARYQVPRIARVRGIPDARLQALIAAHTEGRLLGVLGEPRVNVLELNLALDALK